MEFAYLSDITGNPVYKQKVERIREVVSSLERPKKLYPNYLHPKTGKWGQPHTSVGALGDSFYEYLLKEWLRSGKRDLQVSKKHFFLAYKRNNETSTLNFRHHFHRYQQIKFY